jgi:hypothetical protein
MKRATLLLIFVFVFPFFGQTQETTPVVQVQQATPLIPSKLIYPFSSYSEAEEALRSAEIYDSKNIGTGVTNPVKLYLRIGGKGFKAVFKSVNDRKFGITSTQKGAEVDFKDSYMYEIVAYELDKLLGLNMVPPTVERSFRSKKGSVQLWVENAMTEKDRKLKHLEPPDVILWNNQLFQVRLFDNLIYNIDRNLGNLLIDTDWKIYMIDHSRCFKNADAMKTLDKLSMFSKATMDALDKLNEQAIKGCCSNYLTGPEIKTLLQRRDLIIKHYQGLLASKGNSIYLPIKN